MSLPNPSNSVLVTGATGFVGINLVEALLHRGYDVTCLVRSGSRMGPLQDKNLHFLVGDLLNPDVIQRAGYSFRFVYHVAGAIKASSKERYFRINHTGTLQLLQVLKHTAPNLERFICISSLAAAGPGGINGSITENQPAKPISWYGESKLAAEKEVLRFASVFPVTILRPSAVYGPHDREILLVFRMIKRGCLFTPGRHTRRFSMIHVRDLVNAIIQTGEKPTPSGEIFNISRPEIYSWEEVGRSIASELDVPYRQFSLPKWTAIGAGILGDFWTSATGKLSSINSQKVKELLEPSWTCDTSKAQDVLGFKPEIDLKKGIRDTIHWYQDQGWL